MSPLTPDPENMKWAVLIHKSPPIIRVEAKISDFLWIVLANQPFNVEHPQVVLVY